MKQVYVVTVREREAGDIWDVYICVSLKAANRLKKILKKNWNQQLFKIQAYRRKVWEE